MKPMPYQSPIIDRSGRMSHQWQQWFTSLVAAVDEIRQEPWFEHTEGFTMTKNDLGRVHLMNIGAINATVWLPSVDSTDIYQWVRFVRVGTGTLLIRAADSDKIEYSSQPGRIWCNEPKRTAANMTFMLIQSDTWAIMGGTGIWKVA